MTGRDAHNIIEEAREEYQSDEIQISSCAKVARAEEGDWVEAWIWIPKEETDVSEKVVSIFKTKKPKVPSSTPGE